MSVDRVSLQEILRPKGITPGTREAVDLKEHLPVTPPGLLTGLLLPHAASAQSVKHQGGGTGELEGITIVALDVFVANILVWEVEHSIGSFALGVPVRRGLLDIDSVSAVHVVRQDAFFVVGDLVIKQESLRTKFDSGYAFSTNVEQVALFRVPELSVCLRASELRCLGPLLQGGLTLGRGCNQQKTGDLRCPQHSQLD